MAKQPESNQPSLSSSHDEGREDSGLQDILAVAAKIKDTPDDEPSAASETDSEDSGLIVFSAGDFGGADEPEDDLLSFSGGLGGLGSSTDLLSSPDLTPLSGEGSVRESTAVEPQRRPVEDSKRNPLAVVAVVLGLALITVGVVYLSGDDKQEVPEQAHAEMSARDGDAAVGLAEPVDEPVEPIEALAPVDSGAEGAEEAGLGEAEAEAAAEGEGAPEAGLPADADDVGDADDPMAQKANLLGGGTNPVAKAEKWDSGKTTATTKPSSGPTPEKDPIVEPKPEPKAEPEPEPKPKPSSGSHDDEVDCLLNPDLAKCKTSGGSKSKDQEVLAPKLPESLSSTQLRNGFNTVKSKAKACGAKHGAEVGTKVKVHASIEGATGKVTSVKALGEHAGTELGKCVEGVVEGAVFEQFKKPAMGVDYSLIM